MGEETRLGRRQGREGCVSRDRGVRVADRGRGGSSAGGGWGGRGVKEVGERCGGGEVVGTVRHSADCGY